MNGTKAGAVTGGHVLVKGLDGIRAGEFSELLVHVVCARAGIVADPDAEVLDLQRTLLVDLVGHCKYSDCVLI